MNINDRDSIVGSVFSLAFFSAENIGNSVNLDLVLRAILSAVIGYFTVRFLKFIFPEKK